MLSLGLYIRSGVMMAAHHWPSCKRECTGVAYGLAYAAFSEKVSLNVMANEATFRLIDAALTLGVNLIAVRRRPAAGLLPSQATPVPAAGSRHYDRD